MYVFLIAVLGLLVSAFASEPDKVSVQLAWKYQFEYAGFVAAREKGYYRDAGLEVELREYQDGIDTVTEVMNGQATYGVYNSSLVIEAGRIRPVVLLATYFQHSPLIFVAQKGIKHPIDMVGKTIMGTKDELKNSSLALLLKHFEITPKNARFVDHTYDSRAFIEKKVDVMSAFSSNELYDLDRRHIPYEVIDPAEYGFIMSATNLFTSSQEAIDHPDRTRRFIEATNRGWEYALRHPDEIIRILRKQYHVQKSKAALEYEAKATERLFMRDFFHIGEVNKDLTLRAYKQLMQAGALLPDQKLGRFTFDDITDTMKTALLLTGDEKQYLLQKKVIRMCVDPDWYPFEAIVEGKHIGIAADVMKEFEKKLGIPIQMVPVQSWEESIQKAKDRECDIFSLASSTPERDRYMNFTTPYVNLPIVIATTMDKPFTDGLDQLQSQKLAVVKGYAIGEKLKTQYPELKLVEVGSITEGLKAVEEGLVYGYVDNLIVISSYIQKEYTGVIKVSSRLNENVALSVGTRNDEPLLNTIFQKLVKQIDDPYMQKVYDKWAPTIEAVRWFDTETTLQVSTVLVLLGGFLLWRYRELKSYNEKLLLLSTTDPLTSLFNRLKIDEKLLEESNRLRRYLDYTFSVMILDVDHFKQINDTFGHLKGDEVLQSLARLMREHVRETDIIGRWGGEEFLIILPHTGLTDALTMAEHIRKRIETHDFGINRAVTASIGIGEARPDEELHQLISRIDDALYRVKNSGRNGVSSAS